MVVLSFVINSTNAIWFAINQIRFNNSRIHWKSSIAKIMAEVNLSGNGTRKVSSNTISDFVILKAFNINLHPRNAHVIKEIMWQPPIIDWIKCNFDGACGEVFWNYQADHLGSFAFNINNGNALLAELTCMCSDCN